MIRAAVALIAVLCGIGGALIAGTAADIAGDPTCREVNRDFGADPDAGCYPGSVPRQAAVAGLLFASGLAAVAAMIAGVLAALRSRLGLFMTLIGIVAAALFGAAVVVSRIG